MITNHKPKGSKIRTYQLVLKSLWTTKYVSFISNSYSMGHKGCFLSFTMQSDLLSMFTRYEYQYYRFIRSFQQTLWMEYDLYIFEKYMICTASFMRNNLKSLCHSQKHYSILSTLDQLFQFVWTWFWYHHYLITSALTSSTPFPDICQLLTFPQNLLQEYHLISLKQTYHK